MENSLLKKHQSNKKSNYLLKFKNTKIIQRNLIHVRDLPGELNNKQELISHRFFGQYGKIIRININEETSLQNDQENSFHVHVEYENEFQSSLAMICLRKTKINDLMLKVSFGFNKYCRKFIKGDMCYRQDCNFIHQIMDKKFYKKKQNLYLYDNTYRVDEQKIEKLAFSYFQQKKIDLNFNISKFQLFYPQTLYLAEVLKKYQQNYYRKQFLKKKNSQDNKNFLNNEYISIEKNQPYLEQQQILVNQSSNNYQIQNYFQPQNYHQLCGNKTFLNTNNQSTKNYFTKFKKKIYDISQNKNKSKDQLKQNNRTYKIKSKQSQQKLLVKKGQSPNTNQFFQKLKQLQNTIHEFIIF